MFRVNIASLVALALFVAVGVAEDKAQQEKKEPTKKYFVYGGGCSRSIKLQGSYAEIDQAFDAAENFRTKHMMKWISVRTGNNTDWFGRDAKVYHIYTRGIRCGVWQVSSKVDDYEKASKIVEELTKKGQKADLLAVYVEKK